MSISGAPPEREQIVRDTIAWCNEMRRDQGKGPIEDLPLGHRSDPETCPCGAATGLRVYRNVWMTEEQSRDELMDFGKAERMGQSLPYAVRQFVIAFDRGTLPQYEDNSLWKGDAA